MMASFCMRKYIRKIKMYKILIKYNDKNLWQLYGTSSSTTGIEDSFTPFSSDDIESVKAELATLDAKYDHENIKVIKEIEYTMDVNIADDKE